MDDQVRRLRIELDVMKKAEVPAPAPSERIRIMDAGLVRDHESLSELESVIEQSALGSVLGCSVISEQIRRASEFGEFPAPAITRLRELLLESESSGLNVTARRSVLSAFERSQLEGAAEGESCTSRAREWLSLARQVLHLTELELGRLGRKDLSNTTEYKARQDWEKLFARKQKLLIDAEERLKSIRAMASRSADLEISELLSTREAIRRSLFGSRDDELFFGLSHRVGPAEGWLKYKWRQSQRALREFKRLLPQLRRNWLESDRKLEVREREFACSYTENALLTWALAGKHLESALFFCEVFSQTINPAAHPYVSRYCLGRFNRKGELSKEGLLEERLQEVKAFERDSAAIQLWREKNQCKAIDDHRALSDSDRAPRG